jgi:hypothetical protein
MASDDDQEELVIDEGPAEQGDSGGEDPAPSGPYAAAHKDFAAGGFKAEQTFASILEKCYKCALCFFVLIDRLID